MSFSKLLTFALTATLLTGLCALSATAQKKDDKAPLAPVTPTPATPFSDVRRDNLLNGFQITTLERAEDTPETIFKRADNALYAAKRRGRNRVAADAA